MASLHSPPLYSGKRVMGLPTLPSTTVEDDPYIAPAPKLPEQLLMSPRPDPSRSRSRIGRMVTCSRV